MLNDMLKNSIPLEKLTALGKYYKNLGNYWCCLAFSIEKSPITIIFIPLYFEKEYHQAKLWVSSEKIVGLEFKFLDKDSWLKEGIVNKWIISKPKQILCNDGSILEICSPEEEEKAL